MHRGARCRRQSLVAARRGPARARHHRGCARAGGGARRRQAGRGRVHQRRHGSQQCRAGRRAGRRSCSPASSTTRCWHRREASGAQVVELPVAKRRRRRLQDRSRGICRDKGRAHARCRCSSPTTRPASCSLWPTRRAWRASAALAVHTDAVQAAGRMPIDFARARRRLPDAVRPQARRAQGRRRAGHPRRRQPARASSRAAARSGGAAPAPRTWRPSPASARRPQAARDDLAADGRGCGPCATGWRRRCATITPEAVVIGAEAERLPNTTSLALPGSQRRDAGHRPRPRGHRGERRRGVLVGQGRRQPRAGGDGAWRPTSPAPPSASASARELDGARRRRLPRRLGPASQQRRRERAVA